MKTKTGHPVTLFDRSGPGDYPLRGYVHTPGRAPQFVYWDKNGKTAHGRRPEYDLQMTHPDQEPRL